MPDSASLRGRQAHAENLRLAHRLVTTLECITDAFYTLDPDWRFTYVITAASGPEALPVLQSDREIDLLFTDVIMPGGKDTNVD